MSFSSEPGGQRSLGDPYMILLMLAITLLVYYPVLSAPLLNFDDIGMLHWLSNPYTPPAIKNLFTSGAGTRYYRPLLLSSFVFDHSIWQQEASGYHLTNYLLHAANGLLLFYILRKFSDLFHYDSSVPALSGALLFTLHPLTCESVAWVSGRTDILATFFCLSGFLLYLNGSRFTTAAAFLLGLFSKESAVTFIPILLLADFALQRHKEKNNLQAIASSLVWLVFLFPSLLIYLYLRTRGLISLDAGLQKAVTYKIDGLQQANLSHQSLTTLISYVVHSLATISFYLKKLFFPFPLNFAIYRINTSMYLLLFLTIFTGAVFMAVKKNHSILFWAALLTASFSPALLVANSEIAWMPFAERYLYLSCAVWAAMIFFLVNKLMITFPGSKKTISFCITAILIIWAVATFQRTFTWNSDSSLWTAAYHSSPNSAKVQYKYGLTLITEGSTTKGISLIRKAARRMQDSKWRSFALMALGDEAESAGEINRAKRYYQKALTTHPGDLEHTKLASFFVSLADKSTKPRPLIELAVKHYLAAYKFKKEPNYLYQAAKLQWNFVPSMARKIYKQIITRHPDSQESKYSRKILDRLTS